MIVALTGASGNMGKETLKSLLECEEITTLRILVKQDKKSRKEARKAKRKYGARVEVIEGDVRRYEDCLALVRGAEYVYHLAAVIPPRADHFIEEAVATNYDGTVNMVRAIIEDGNTAKMIHISTVALYGNRDEKHPWGQGGRSALNVRFRRLRNEQTARRALSFGIRSQNLGGYSPNGYFIRQYADE